MKLDTSPSNGSFDRPKLLLFRFLAHQIHPFAYAVNTFLQPALDDCRTLLQSHPQDAFNILISLTQTFIRFAPDAELIYNDIQQFARKLKDSIDECFAWLDPDAIRQSAQLLETTHQGLSAIIQQQNDDSTTYTNIYKNMSAVLSNLQKINSLPIEVEAMSMSNGLDTTIPIQKVDKSEEAPMGNDFHQRNGHHDAPSKETVTTSVALASAIQSLAVSRPTSATSFLNGYGSAETTDRSDSTAQKADLNMEDGRQFYAHPYFFDREVADAYWHPLKSELSVIVEQSHINNRTATAAVHVTDQYMQDYTHQPSTARSPLLGDLCMTFGTPQSSPQTTCMPIGVGLSYDELTLLSCDVHRTAQNVRLFDVRTGQLRHTIVSTSQMKLHRPSAVMSNARDQILIVERERIYITDPDGRLVQTIGHSTIKQLYGIALFRDHYLLTIESKATDSDTAENSRLLLFDPNSGQLVFEQHIVINKGSEAILEQQNINRIQGRILPETKSKPRFLAVHNDCIYIADLGRSLIYGTSIRNQFDFSCTTVFGGHGRANGEMTDPSGLIVDSGGNVISADSKNNRIQVFTPDGEYRTTMQLNERIKRPSGICMNRAGTQLYVSCYLAGCVHAFDVTY